jgi:hypothetical protein
MKKRARRYAIDRRMCLPELEREQGSYPTQPEIAETSYRSSPAPPNHGVESPLGRLTKDYAGGELLGTSTQLPTAETNECGPSHVAYSTRGTIMPPRATHQPGERAASFRTHEVNCNCGRSRVADSAPQVRETCLMSRTRAGT